MAGWTALESSHAKILSADMFGLGQMYYPGGGTVSPSITYGLARSHDWNAGLANCYALTKWCNVERTKGVFDWTYVDQFVNAHKAVGRKVLLTIDGTPAWAVAAPIGTGAYYDLVGVRVAASSTCPDDIHDFANWCSAVATRYGTDCCYEVWNEPNFIGGTAGYWVDTAEKLAALMRVGYAAIKAVNPSLLVVSPSCTGAVGKLYQLLAASDGAGGRGIDHFDVLGFHFYSEPLSLVTSEPSWHRVNSVKSVLKQLGRPGCEVWNTETGVDSNGYQYVTEAERRTYIRQFFALRIALGIYVNVFAYYDSGSMGLKLPANTGSTYDMTPHWDEFVLSVLGKTLIKSVIDRDRFNNLVVALHFSDGTTVSA